MQTLKDLKLNKINELKLKIDIDKMKGKASQFDINNYNWLVEQFKKQYES